MTETRRFVVIGGGPAGLTAAYELTRHGLRPCVVEGDDVVGGLARTVSRDGFSFDMGGHRFFTKAAEVDSLWREILADGFLTRGRLSRIYYRRKFFDYPLKPMNALLGLGPWEALRVLASYLRWQIKPHPREDTFEQWVVNRFGDRLFRIFFKSYTEKVWGISCSELKAEWAAQRIKDLSLKSAVMSMFFKPKKTIKTLIEEFDYPRLGPGMMWNTMARAIDARGGSVTLRSPVVKVIRRGNRVEAVVVHRDGKDERIDGTDFISSMPITELVKAIDPPAPAAVREAASRLNHRDFLTVCLIVDRPQLFLDNWIYVHDPGVKVGRIQNFKNWSPDMVPDAKLTSLGLEYFCTRGDELWSMPDAELVKLGCEEMQKLGLVKAGEVLDGHVFRMPRAYPIYDGEYGQRLAVVREFVDGLENLQTVGRNGLHRYNNQDHAMLTGMYAARNALGLARNDLWAVNTDSDYHEAGVSPGRNPRRAEAVVQSLATLAEKLDRVAFGVASAVVCGLSLGLVTLGQSLSGGHWGIEQLSLLSQFLPGYSISVLGSLLALAYGLVGGFALGWVFALLRNAGIYSSFWLVHRRTQLKFMKNLLDYL